MQFVRRASLVFSLVLIVAIAVGFVARKAELAGERDLRMTTAAELGAAQLASIVDATVVAAQSSGDPAATAGALAAVHSQLGVCAVRAIDTACDGDGPAPPAAEIDAARTGRTEGDAPAAGARSMIDVVAYDSLLTITATGAELTVVATAPIAVVDASSGLSVKATTMLAADQQLGGFTVDQGWRRTFASVDGAAGLYVIVEGADEAPLPPDEYRFYVVIFTLAVVLLVLASVTLLVEQRNLLERASFDPLTKLPNRSEFERRAEELLADAEREEAGMCLLLFDLNGFKQVNDTHGHIAGDEMLKVVGARLRKAVRDDDVVARWGGDEFVVVMPGIATEEMGGRRARQLAEQISGRTRIDGVDEALRVKVSVGVSVWPSHGPGLDELVSAADQAMYEAKRQGVVCRVAEAPAEAPVPVVLHG